MSKSYVMPAKIVAEKLCNPALKALAWRKHIILCIYENIIMAVLSLSCQCSKGIRFEVLVFASRENS